MSEIDDRQRCVVRDVIERYFQYSSPPINYIALRNLFDVDYEVVYPSGRYTPRNYITHVKRTALLARILFKKSRVYPLNLPPNTIALEGGKIEDQDDGGSDASRVEWEYEYTWRLIGKTARRRGYNAFDIIDGKIRRLTTVTT